MTKKIIYSCPYVPAEWIAAHGLEPERLIPDADKAGSCLPCPQGICPYARYFIGSVIHSKCRAVVVTTLCDQMRRAFDIIIRQYSKPAFLMNIPSTWQSVTAQKLYIDELRRLGNFLVSLGGQAPSDDMLADIMLNYDTIRKKLLDTRNNMSAIDFALKLEEFGRTGLNLRLNEISGYSHPAGYINLAVLGSPMIKQDLRILELAEMAGGRIVLNATENGERGICKPFDRRNIRNNPLLELADAYFNGIHDASNRPNSMLYQWLRKEFIKRQVQGIIFHRNIWCDIWHAELHRFRNWVKLPVLDIDSTGESEPDQHRIRNRINAFLETLR